MRVLVACEESQEVCKAFRARGHEAYSCDLQECSGGHPEWHIKEDAVRVAWGEDWDLMIAHPPCRYLAWSGERWMAGNADRLKKRNEALGFFRALHTAPIKKKCIENSLSWFLRRNYMWETQLIHPFHFGEPFRKSTCIWLTGLKPLVPTNIIFKREPSVHNMWPCKERAKLRSKTFPGIARAMAEQWG